MAARTTKIRHDENTRLKIKTSQLLNRLTNHAFGKVELQPTQVRAIEILLKKTMPDLAQVSGSVHVTRDPVEMSDADLADIAAGRSARAIAQADGAPESDQVH